MLARKNGSENGYEKIMRRNNKTKDYLTTEVNYC